MKEFDFDELDKAVSSLMGGVPKEDSSSDVTPKQAPITEPAPASVEPAPVVPRSSTPVSVAPKARPTPSPATKRSGRFMDMVPSSSAPKQRANTASFPNRVGVTIAPREASPSSAANSIDTVFSPVKKPLKPETEQQSWPDPLDLMNPQSSVEDEKPVVASPSPAPKPLYQPAELNGASPFLSDAKVEKRPLGSEASTKPTVVDAQDSNEADNNTNTEKFAAPAQEEPIQKQEKVTDEPPLQPLQPELSNDLLSIEAGEIKESSTHPSPAAAASVSTRATPLDHRLSEHGSSDVPDSPVPQQQPVSITQQYKEQHSSGDQEHAAIYDTETYPAPLSHPVKKKSGWLWVVWILLLLAVGAGGAIALYLLHII